MVLGKNAKITLTLLRGKADVGIDNDKRIHRLNVHDELIIALAKDVVQLVRFRE